MPKPLPRRGFEQSAAAYRALTVIAAVRAAITKKQNAQAQNFAQISYKLRCLPNFMVMRVRLLLIASWER